MRRILVTRPEPGASETAGRLEAVGFEVVRLPLTRIEAVDPERVPDPSEYDAVVVTSANALRNAGAALLESIAGCRCYAVGARTAEAATEAGLMVVTAGDGNAEALATAIVATEPESRILYLCGRVRRESFERKLSQAGIHVEAIETYDARPVCYSAEAFFLATGGNPIWGALVYSVAGARRLAELMADHQADGVFERMRFFCMSDRVADGLSPTDRDRILVASRPTEEAVLEMVRSVD